MREFVCWLKDVRRHWQVNLTGGILIAAIFLYQSSGKSVPWWVYAGTAIATLFVSCFLAWRDQHRKRKAESFLLLLEQCRELYQIVSNWKDPSPNDSFCWIPETADEIKLRVRLQTILQKHAELSRRVFQGRKLSYADSFEGSPKWTSRELRIGLEKHIKLLENTVQDILHLSKPPSFPL